MMLNKLSNASGLILLHYNYFICPVFADNNNFLPKFSFALRLSLYYFKMAAPCCFKQGHSVHCWKVNLNLFWLVHSCFITKILEMDCSKQTQISSQSAKASESLSNTAFVNSSVSQMFVDIITFYQCFPLRSICLPNF